MLGEDQIDICRGFARESNAFDGLDWQTNDVGTPLINGCVSRFECTLYAQHDAGDHTIIIGKVFRASQSNLAPLCFSKGSYQTIAK